MRSSCFRNIRSFILLLTGLFLSPIVVAQDHENPILNDFKGTISLTNNGISLVPSFSLGAPALLFDLKFTKGKFSFEPDMRFALEGKPWSFIFWFRHRVIENEKFSLRIGAHPALNFRTVSIIRDGRTENILESRRYLAAELAPSHKITENIGVGLYYLYGRGLDAGVKQTNFLVLNSYFNNLYISDKFFLNITPQIYYLGSDELKGYYVAGFIFLKKKDFPLSLGAILNKAIDTEIIPEDDFTWNLSLIYRFPKNSQANAPTVFDVPDNKK